MALINPVRRNYRLRLPKPLPKHLRDEQVAALFKEIADTRDRAMFMLMLRCGLRVEEVARLTADAIEYRRRQLYVFNGKGSKDRVVYLSEDALSALQAYMQKRRRSKEKRVFLVQKGPLRGKPISVRGIRVFSFFNRILIRWVRRKYKRFKFHQLRASQWLRGIACKQPWLFAHWGNGFRP
jgi:site-specific recombinase XerD